MGRRQDNHQHDAATVVNSSIALLQERFRQLEKVKERREGKELLKLFSSSSYSSSSSDSSSSVHFQASQQQQQQQQPNLVPGSLSLGLNQPNRQGHHYKTPSTSTLWPQQGASISNFEHYSDVDIDTSLHL